MAVTVAQPGQTLPGLSNTFGNPGAPALTPDVTAALGGRPDSGWYLLQNPSGGWDVAPQGSRFIGTSATGSDYSVIPDQASFGNVPLGNLIPTLERGGRGSVDFGQVAGESAAGTLLPDIVASQKRGGDGLLKSIGMGGSGMGAAGGIMMLASIIPGLEWLAPIGLGLSIAGGLTTGSVGAAEGNPLQAALGFGSAALGGLGAGGGLEALGGAGGAADTAGGLTGAEASAAAGAEQGAVGAASEAAAAEAATGASAAAGSAGPSLSNILSLAKTAFAPLMKALTGGGSAAGTSAATAAPTDAVPSTAAPPATASSGDTPLQSPLALFGPGWSETPGAEWTGGGAPGGPTISNPNEGLETFLRLAQTGLLNPQGMMSMGAA